MNDIISPFFFVHRSSEILPTKWSLSSNSSHPLTYYILTTVLLIFDSIDPGKTLATDDSLITFNHSTAFLKLLSTLKANIFAGSSCWYWVFEQDPRVPWTTLSFAWYCPLYIVCGRQCFCQDFKSRVYSALLIAGRQMISAYVSLKEVWQALI